MEWLIYRYFCRHAWLPGHFTCKKSEFEHELAGWGWLNEVDWVRLTRYDRAIWIMCIKLHYLQYIRQFSMSASMVWYPNTPTAERCNVGSLEITMKPVPCSSSLYWSSLTIPSASMQMATISSYASVRHLRSMHGNQLNFSRSMVIATHLTA